MHWPFLGFRIYTYTWYICINMCVCTFLKSQRCNYCTQGRRLWTHWPLWGFRLQGLGFIHTYDTYIYIIYMYKYVCVYISEKSALESFYVEIWVASRLLRMNIYWTIAMRSSRKPLATPMGNIWVLSLILSLSGSCWCCERFFLSFLLCLSHARARTLSLLLSHYQTNATLSSW